MHWPTLFSAGLFPVIVLVHGWLARSEEKRVIEDYGEEYRTYQRQVSMFIQRKGQWGKLYEQSNKNAGKDE